MHELLVDELTGDEVILAPARALRPDTFRVTATPSPATAAGCPFCPGNEAETPPEVARTGPGAADTPGWHVRVVPNKYPAVGEGVPGAHEVAILSPAHDASFGLLAADGAADVLVTLRDRARYHLEHGCKHAQVFVNHGKAAGASIEHPHAQLVALTVVPPRVRARVERFSDARLRDDQRHVVVDGPVRVWCPLASTTPFAIRLAPTDAGPRFDQAGNDQLRATAVTLRDTLGRLRAVLGDVAYNAVVQSAPVGVAREFRWWIDVVPRLTVTAGFEQGTGIWINIVDPAAAAAALRDAR